MLSCPPFPQAPVNVLLLLLCASDGSFVQIHSNKLRIVHVSLLTECEKLSVLLTILLAFQNCTTLITFFAKQIGPVNTANTCGHVNCLKNHTTPAVVLGKRVKMLAAWPGRVVVKLIRELMTVWGRRGVL